MDRKVPVYLLSWSPKVVVAFEGLTAQNQLIPGDNTHIGIPPTIGTIVGAPASQTLTLG